MALTVLPAAPPFCGVSAEASPATIARGAGCARARRVPQGPAVRPLRDRTHRVAGRVRLLPRQRHPGAQTPDASSTAPAAMTPLDKPLKREVLIDDAPYVLTLDPAGLKLVPKGKRKGLELRWTELVSGDAALATALQASLETR